MTGPDTLPSVSTVSPTTTTSTTTTSTTTTTTSSSSIPTPTADRWERGEWVTASLWTRASDTMYDSLTDSFSLTPLSTGEDSGDNKREFLQNRCWSELRIWIEWPQMKSQNDTEAPSQSLNCLLTISLVSAGLWEDQRLDVSTLYYSLVG